MFGTGLKKLNGSEHHGGGWFWFNGDQNSLKKFENSVVLNRTGHTWGKQGPNKWLAQCIFRHWARTRDWGICLVWRRTQWRKWRKYYWRNLPLFPAVLQPLPLASWSQRAGCCWLHLSNRCVSIIEEFLVFSVVDKNYKENVKLVSSGGKVYFCLAPEVSILEPYNLMLDGNSATCMTLNWTQQLVFDLWEKPTVVNVKVKFSSPLSCNGKKVNQHNELKIENSTTVDVITFTLLLFQVCCEFSVTTHNSLVKVITTQ